MGHLIHQLGHFAAVHGLLQLQGDAVVRHDRQGGGCPGGDLGLFLGGSSFHGLQRLDGYGQIQCVLQDDRHLAAGNGTVGFKAAGVGGRQVCHQTGADGSRQIGTQPQGRVRRHSALGGILCGDAQGLHHHGDEVAPTDGLIGTEAQLIAHRFTGEQTGVSHPFRGKAAAFPGGVGILAVIQGL